MGPLRGAFLASLWFGLAAFAAGSSPQSSPGSPPQPLAAQAASPQVAEKFDVNDCRTCHEKALTSFEHTRHMKVPGLCENCHGDVANHLKSETEKGEVGTIISLKTMKPADINKTCLGCHDKMRQADWKGGVHDRRGLACTSCHSIHDFHSPTAQLKTTREADTCFSCHPQMRAKSLRTSHHPVREGKMGCLNCHDPHGSNHDKLLQAKLPYLCQRCHLNTRHPGSLYDFRNTIAGTNVSNRAVEHACKNCHQNVHGTNAPSGPYLG